MVIGIKIPGEKTPDEELGIKIPKIKYHVS
jgi:hypothetical protein